MLLLPLALVTLLTFVSWPAQAQPTDTASCGIWQEMYPLLPGSSDTRIFNISVLSSNDVWVVGGYSNGEVWDGQPVYHPLVEHWNGSQWMWSSLENLYGLQFSPEFRSVGASGPNDVWAGGYYFRDGPPLPSSYSRAAHWDGTAWHRVSELEEYDETVWDIVVLASNDVWLVQGKGPAHWDGTAWSWPYSPTIHIAFLSGAPSIGVWGIDTYNAPRTLFHWDGTQWIKVVNLPTAYSNSPWLVLSPADIWVNDWGNSGMWHWDGIGWKRFAIPRDLVYQIAGRSANDIWTIAGFDIIHWNGSAWTIAYTSATYWAGIAVAPGGDVWVAGEQSVKHYTPCRRQWIPLILQNALPN